MVLTGSPKQYGSLVPTAVIYPKSRNIFAGKTSYCIDRHLLSSDPLGKRVKAQTVPKRKTKEDINLHNNGHR